jgi:hypothetical protein
MPGSNPMPSWRIQQWNDLSDTQKTGLRIGAVVQIGLLIVALIDIRRRPAEQIRGSKVLWTAIACVNFVGPISYFVFGRKKT